MKRVLIIFFFITVIPFSLLYGGTKEIIIAYENKEQPPYYMGNSGEVLPKPGVAVEMVKLLEKEIPGLKITLIRLPWPRCLSELKKNEVQGIFNASFKTERLKIGAYPKKDGEVDPGRRITTITYSLYKLKTSSIKWDGKRFYNVKGPIGAPRGYSIVKDLEKKGITVDEANSTLANLIKITSRRIEAAALQEVTADSIIESNQAEFSDIVKISVPLAEKPYYLMLSLQFVAENPELAEEIWSAIARIRETQLKELAKKYME